METNSYDNYIKSIKDGIYGNFYIFHGSERYLLDHSLTELRKNICPEGLDSFNYKRFDNRNITTNSLEDAVNALPFFAERTLIEVHDLDIFRGRKSKNNDDEQDDLAELVEVEDTEKQRYVEILSDIPDYACLVLIYSTVPFKPDSRKKLDKEILLRAHVVEFAKQEQSKLIRWISRRFEANSKHISKSDAEYLALITDGNMSALVGEIEKISAYCDDEIITRSDIDAVVVPVLNAIIYKLTDAILTRRFDAAMVILDELFLMREPAHKTLFGIASKMRQFLATRVLLDSKKSRKDLMDLCGIRYDFQATMLMDTAKKTTVDKCRSAVLVCSEAAYDMNNSSDPDDRLIELITQLAYI